MLLLLASLYGPRTSGKNWRARAGEAKARAADLKTPQWRARPPAFPAAGPIFQTRYIVARLTP